MSKFYEQDQQILGDIYAASDAMDNLEILCDEYGSRFSGTVQEHEAAEFIAQKLCEYGLSNVTLEEIPLTGWKRGQAKLEIISPIQKEIACITLPYSPPCELETTLVDIGDGKPVDFDTCAETLLGKLVMANSKVSLPGVNRWVHRKEKFNRSTLAGAAGFIFVNHYPGYGPATGGIGQFGNAAAIPGISIAYEDGEFLKRLIKRKGEVKLRLSTTDSFYDTKSLNVLADIPGQDADSVVMLGSHYDGHDIAQGAVDPASGTVSVLEAARVLAKYVQTPPATIRFAFWGIEEIGLLGSRYYVDQHLDELDNLRFYLNMDAAGSDFDKGINLNEWPDLQAQFEAWADDMALDMAVGQSLMAFSDHYPFFLQGVPTGGMEAVTASRTGRGYGHTHYDTFDKVLPKRVREAASLGARLALRIAHADDFPVSRRSQEDIRALLDSPSYREEEALRERVNAHYQALGRG